MTWSKKNLTKSGYITLIGIIAAGNVQAFGVKCSELLPDIKVISNKMTLMK